MKFLAMPLSTNGLVKRDFNAIYGRGLAFINPDDKDHAWRILKAQPCYNYPYHYYTQLYM